ncbi:MAG: phospholipase [Anaerolineaceae bacterium]|nr:phospholipase [Anaerolineaceae bacterium]
MSQHNQEWDLHGRQPVLSAGQPLGRARAAMIMLHGRGAGAQDILGLADALAHPGFAYLAPEAAGGSWYPYGFLSPIEHNEPYLSSALETIAGLLQNLEEAGMGANQTMLLGFSQGACLALEFAARHARRYGGVAALSGGLIGPEGTSWDSRGSLSGTPILLACSDHDPHIPRDRVLESADVLRRMGGNVTARLYPELGHTINEDELRRVRAMMDELTPG